jgi:oligogalacturonide transport system substrate-binding protein
MSKAISRRDFLKVTGAVGAAGLLAACGSSASSTSTAASEAASDAASEAVASEAEAVAGPSSDPVTLTMCWWGGDSRHEAVQNAIAAFQEKNPTITVNPTFAAWSGWEDTMSTKFAGGVAEDVCMVNWNWLFNYSGNGQTFINLTSVSDYLALTLPSPPAPWPTACRLFRPL